MKTFLISISEKIVVVLKKIIVELNIEIIEIAHQCIQWLLSKYVWFIDTFKANYQHALFEETV